MDTNDKNTTTPELRFPEFHGDWQKKTLGEIMVERTEHSTITDELPLLSFTIEEGVIYPESKKTNKRDFLIKDKDNKKYSVVRLNDIVYNPANVVYGAIHRNSLRDGVVSPIYKIFYTNQDAIFMGFIVRVPKFIQTMTIYMEGTVQKLKTLKSDSFLKLDICIPLTLPEQSKIASCLSSLDDLITHTRTKVDLLKQHKKGLMQKLFPKKDGTICGRGHGRDAKFCVSTNPTIVPELRFPEFSGDWQVKRLGDVAEINPKSLEPIPTEFYYIDLESVCSGRLQKRQIVQLLNAPSRAQRQFQRDDILFQTVRPYQKNNLYVDFDCSNYIASTGYAVIRCTKEISDSKFIYFVLHKDDFVKSVLDKCTGTSYPAINPSVLGSLSVSLPTLAEQRKIAACLSSIDTAIEETENKLRMLEQHKKGLMQKMFVKM